MVLRVIDKELAELQELVKVLQDQNCLSLHPNTDNLYVNPENSTELVGIVNYAVVLMPQTLPVSVIENISTTNQWYFQFPTFMYPVLYLGRTAPKESFYKLYMREQTQGIMGEYTWYQNMDNKITQVAKRLICHLHKRQVIVSCFQANVSGLITLELQREQMIFEDSRSFLVQRYDLIQKRKQKKGVLLGCWDGVVGCLMPKRKHAKIYAMQQEDEECNKCIKSIQTFLNKKVRMTKITQIASQLRTQLKKFLRQLFSLNYDFYDKDIAEQIKNVEAFRYVDIPELCRKLSELNRQYLSSKFRRMSWTTGEKVFVNTEGNLIDPTQAVFPKLQGMSSVYHRMQIANTDQDTGCVEAMIGGGLESQYVVLRVLEDEQINARGVPIYEHFTPQIISRHMQDYFPNYRKLYEDNRDQIDYGVVLRTLFAYHPLCSCCRSAAASSWSSRDKLLCSKYACTHTNQVPMQPLPEQSKMVDRVFDLVVHIRYREAEMLNNGRGLIKLQAAMRGRLVRKRKNRSGNKRTYNK
ncbi:hypothetical protein EON65_18375 [archaeon]|nr:MAG: hypothetical protein EON65_18375 [archaeon]